ncbi:M56 family metallopeptidase [Actinomadura rupiterrae]|uniref:M56 family metallopeptidase n=1 Tax=Actinomadura rupiterrae TaxID=559627 RepID=UPI0020A2EB9F|nr:M56 family metallopeptidase [Actinomadura rupiterrae]MCP2338874.1 hypothetical protein [Actinomadura rupiterrae]
MISVLPWALAIVACLTHGRLALRLPPAAASRLVVALSMTLAVAGAVGLSLLALDGLLGTQHFDNLTHLLPASARHAQTAGPLMTSLALLLLSAQLAMTTTAAWQEARKLREASRMIRHLGTRQRYVVVDSPSAEAFAIPGRPARVIISTGLLTVLGERECQAMLAHEESHLTHRHHRYRATLRVSTAALPLLWPLRRTLDFLLERWADEDAAQAVGSRRIMARAIATSALAAPSEPSLNPPGLGLALKGAEREGVVPRRVRALLAPSPARRPFHIALPLTLIAGAFLADALTAHSVDHLIETTTATTPADQGRMLVPNVDEELPTWSSRAAFPPRGTP